MKISQTVLAAALSGMVGLAAATPVAEARGGHFGGAHFGGGRFVGGVDRGIGWRGAGWRGRRIYRWGAPAVAGAWIAAGGPYYYTGCDRLYAKAARTGSSYWWAMHRACYNGE
jgi:hypothetical protein